MNKLLLVSLLVMLCIANVNATRFLEDTEVNQKTEIAPQKEEIKEEVTPVVPDNTQQQTKEANSTDAKDQVKEQNNASETQEQNNGDQNKEPVKEEKVDEQNKEAVKEEKKEEDTKVIPQEDPKVIPQEENKETKQETEEEKKEDEKVISPTPDNKETSYFGLSFGFILVLAASVLFFFVGFYRYSLRKYKIPPFSPPNFCPNFLFPRPENDLLMEDYCIQSGTEMGGVYSSEKYHNFY
ncbi:transmembrane protein, putative (macronuclear) [Tetrahymena thermophila SB210]|uniref:Transmembrane protein, putative n=1 Tax=Tetrahymena thermophila (strain SB210) TaxID=312017 RepID=I7M8L5_TETTS|nr:transmembrane protein, putative [Tetrahymena thermophila SB210]EAR98407.1 transmembrane protein, putative [Tetrahymena thermophila SB210]|eukprot:XP_001018652.1 transmembrane protein, putative [Tetrahymena thermophila SB210]